MKMTTIGVLAALASVSVAGSAGAQICASFPTVDRQLSFGANVLLTEGVDFGQIWGVEASYNAAGPLSVFGGVTVFDPEGDDNSQDSFGAGLAFELPTVGAMMGPGVSACPRVSVSYTDIEDLGTVWGIPVGFGVGTNLSAGTGLTISPYVIPQVLFTRFEADDDGLIPGADESETSFALEGGAVLGFGTFWIGGLVSHVFEDEQDPTFGIRAGIRL
jgi:hypothetical protein